MPNESNVTPNDESIDDVIEDQPIDDQSVDDEQHPPQAGTSTPQVAAEVDDEHFGKLTPREKALVERARAQEKQKLYKQLNTAEERLRQLQQPTPPSTTPRSGQTSTTRSARDVEIASLTQQITDMNSRLEQREKRERERELRDYRREKIGDLRRRNVGFVESLVMGDSEELIDASINLAIAEHALKESEFRSKYGITDSSGNGTTPQTHERVVVRASARGRPEGTPSVVGAGVGGDSSNVLTKAEIAALTSEKAIRDGTYAANRDRIKDALQSGRIRNT